MQTMKQENIKPRTPPPKLSPEAIIIIIKKKNENHE
jgi:hypothetical protein